MQFRKPHPWDGNYAIPDYVMAEPPLRGTATTKYRTRGTIDAPAIPKPWRTGYAYPGYVSQEPLGRGVYNTKYMPRKTVDTLVPQYLGDDEEPNVESDPIENFGKQVSLYIMGTVKQLPPSERKRALKAVFDQLDPHLWGRVAARGSVLQSQGMPASLALRKAIAEKASMGLLEEFIRVGKSGTIKTKSMSGLAAYGDASLVAALEGFHEALGLSWGDLNPLSWAAKGTSKITSTVTPYGAKVGEWGKGVLSQVGDLACNVASSRLGQVAAGAGAGAAGAPPEVGAKGAALVSSACAGQQPAVAYQPPQKSSMLPIMLAAGAGIIALVVILK